MSNKDIITQNILSRDLLIEIILTAVIISFGLNLFVASFSNSDEFNIVLFTTGAVVILSSVTVLIYRNFKKFDRTIKITGFFIYDAKNNNLVNIPNYTLSHELTENLNAALKEDESLEFIWNTASLIDHFKPSNDGRFSTRSKELIEELFEYFIFDRLSLTLGHFFIHGDFKKEDLEEYGRDDIPDTLLNNRFLNLFSKPIEEREAFYGEDLENGVFLEQKDKKTLFMHIGKDKTLYQRLHLILPKGTAVKRHESKGIMLESDKLFLNFDINFEGLNQILPPLFLEYYLGFKNEFVSLDESVEIFRFQIFQLDLNIDVKFKIKSLFSNNVWKYNKWLDMYVNLLDKDISNDAFFESLNWEQTEAIMYMMEKNLFNRGKNGND